MHDCSVGFLDTTQCGGKALSPMVVIVLGKVMLVSDEHLSKAPAPMVVMDSCKVILVSDLQPWKVSSSMIVIVLGK